MLNLTPDQMTALNTATEHVPTAICSSGRILTNARHRASKRAGWWHDLKTGLPLIGEPRIIPEKLMLVVSEIAEAMEGHRKGLMDDKLPDRLMIEVELAAKLAKLGTFIRSNPSYDKLPYMDQCLLQQQEGVMQMYQSLLKMRIYRATHSLHNLEHKT